MSEAYEASVNRILVTIDLSPLGAATLEAAARLATEFRADLEGLYIEDVSLLHLAGLPFAKEIDYSSGVLRPLDTEAMEWALRSKAEGVRQAIEKTAQRTSLRWSFRISRGHVAKTMLTESSNADLILIGRETISPGSQAPRAHRGPIMFFDDGSGSSLRVFETAQRLARLNSDTIVALVTRETVAPAVESRQVPLPVYVQQCSGDIDALLHAVQQWRPQLLLLDRTSSLISESTIDSLVMQLSCPLALVH